MPDQIERGVIDAAAVNVLNAHGRIVGSGIASRQSAGQRPSGGGRLGIGIKKAYQHWLEAIGLVEWRDATCGIFKLVECGSGAMASGGHPPIFI